MFEKIKMIAAIQVPLVALLLLMLICGVLLILIWRISKEVASKDRGIGAKDEERDTKSRDLAAGEKTAAEKTDRLEYGAWMFETLAAYLSDSSDDVYLILNEDREVAYATPNLERVMCRSQEEIAAGFRGADYAADTEELQKFVR